MALSRHHTSITRPLSIQEIVAEAQDFEFYAERPLQSWLRSARMLLTEAGICESEGNIQMAYLYTYRHAELILSKISQHPDIKNPKLKNDISFARKQVNEDLVKLERWKPKINEDHAKYVKAAQRRREDRAKLEQQRIEDAKLRRMSLDSLDGSPIEDIRSLNPFEDRQLAVDIARQELLRRGVNNSATNNTRRPLSIAARDREHSDRYQYPAVPSKEAALNWKSSIIDTDRRPTLPPKLSQSDQVPPKIADDGRKVIFKINAHTEGGDPLRTVFLPPTLRQTFLNVADKNTARNFETCGVLCATSVSNALIISHLVIPDQTSTSDTCDTTEEGDVELFDFCDKENLLVCGWIHTHPSQSCFLSSRDVHTSSGYQQMLPEAIAIVCAPRHNPDWGIFRLTDPPGLPAILMD